MMLVRTKVAPSGIHGLGVFADEDVNAGTVLWRHHPLLDLVLSHAQVEALPETARAFVETYGYGVSGAADGVVLNADDGRFMNHSPAPNTDFSGELGIAAAAIPAGTEITCDYRQFCTAGWLADYAFLDD